MAYGKKHPVVTPNVLMSHCGHNLLTLGSAVKSSPISGSQLAKMKKSIPDMSLYEIYRDEAVGLKIANILEKLRYLWKCEIWGNIMRNWYFANNCLIEIRI